MSLKQKTFKGVIWSAVERFSTQGVQFLFGILLARLLTPNDYGMIAMLAILPTRPRYSSSIFSWEWPVTASSSWRPPL